MTDLNTFDRIAPYYDRLARLVFGNSILRAQSTFLHKLASSTHILVLGGGSGAWLPELLAINPGCRILFIESSSKMLELAKKTTGGDGRVTFLHGTEHLLQSGSSYDAVITFFILDVFSDKLLQEFVNKITASLMPGGIWLATDFVKKKWWHRGMLYIMYRFFKLTAGLQNQRLPDWELALGRAGLTSGQDKIFWSGFIKSAVYQNGSRKDRYGGAKDAKRSLS